MSQVAQRVQESMRVRMQDWLVRYGFIAVTVILFTWFILSEETFRQPSTLFSMLKFTSVVAIVGLGVTFTMVVGGLDLSVGSVAGLGVTVSAMMMVIYNLTGLFSGAMVLVAGAVVGIVNAILIVWMKIPDLLATLGMMFIIMGLKLLPVDGQSVSSKMILRDGTVAPGRFTDGFLQIDRLMIGIVPLPVVLWIVLTFIAWFMLTRTRYGRIMYAVGANPEAARLAGIRVEWYRASAYVISGLFAAIGGMILSSRIGQGDISAGNSLLLDAVAVALVGTSVLGIGKPNAWGTALGALLIGIVITGLTIKGFPYYAQDIAKGLVLVVALTFSFTLSRKKARFVPAT
ncbi:MAG: ABC transporter permease [Microbacteriaceae bacterium]|jgi:simple sugar transport system permease protein|nr:ABC transporter permease [Pontimonas sp.]MBT4908490.1 ABC transporter permease [Microbacteriaceae bacterium]MBT5248292.1 ABC transporter permease [Microbacteriaceae bacterium]MBT5616204.1 ABC transporter permease [Microbacteriaceae bacterium]MBT5730847.1 ABC transporter permease [Microbacteriaceae bacterium]MDA9117049.1 ABC transporter permease [Pontimonas sp.]